MNAASSLGQMKRSQRSLDSLSPSQRSKTARGVQTRQYSDQKYQFLLNYRVNKLIGQLIIVCSIDEM